jgi:hypothetical protein
MIMRYLSLYGLFFFLIHGNTLCAQSDHDSRWLAAADATNPLAFVTKIQGEPGFSWKDRGARKINLTSRLIQPSASVGLPFIRSKNPDHVYTVYRLEAFIIGQSFPETPQLDAVGLSDLILNDIVVFKRSWGLVGVGPGLIIPTMRPEAISSGKWSAGPSGVLLITKAKGLSWGVMAQQFFSFGGDDDRSSQNFMLLQPMINKLLGGGKFLSLNSTFKLDWANVAYSIPIGVNFGKAFARNLSLLFGPEYVVHGPNEGDFTFRFQINAMFPPDH